MVQFSAPISLPAKSAFFLVRAIGLIEAPRVGVQFEASLFEEPGQPGPMSKGVADTHGHVLAMKTTSSDPNK